MINIRKFRSVRDFVERVRSLDSVLQNIESYSNEVRGLSQMDSGNTPTGTPDIGNEEEEEQKGAQA